MASENDLVAIPSWKQGTMRQGGPADTMLRRIVLPEAMAKSRRVPIDEKVDADQHLADWQRIRSTVRA